VIAIIKVTFSDQRGMFTPAPNTGDLDEQVTILNSHRREYGKSGASVTTQIQGPDIQCL
jgi:hypothetical protein